MKKVLELQREILMEGHLDDGKFGRGKFDKWISEESLNYCYRYIIKPSERISLSLKNRIPYVFEEYGELIASAALVGSITLSAGISHIPPDHQPMVFRKQNCEEALYIISGTGIVEVENEKHDFIQDDAVFLPAWAKHRITNTGKVQLVVMFVRGIAMSPFEGFGEIEVGNEYKFLNNICSISDKSTFSRKLVRYWKKIVVTDSDKIPHYSPDGHLATSPGQQGLNYLTSANVGSLTIRLVGGKGAATYLGKKSNRYKEFRSTWHNTEEIHYFLEGEGTFIVDEKKIPFKKGDMIFTPARSMHLCYPKDESYREMCATGIRLRPFEGLTETAIDQREYILKDGEKL